MIKKLLRIFILLFVFTTTLLIKQASAALTPPPPEPTGAEDCGPGYVCWESNGGSRTVFSVCKAYNDGGYCGGWGGTAYCDCGGSDFCDCTIPKEGDAGGANCSDGDPYWGDPILADGECSDFSGSCKGDGADCGTYIPYSPAYQACTVSGSSCNTGEDCGIYGGWCQYHSVTPAVQPTCYTGEDDDIDATWECPDPTGTFTIGCCYGETASPTPVVGAPTVGAGTPVPTPLAYFAGGIYDDVNATVIGLGGTDNLCTGSTATSVNSTGATATISRTGESNSASINSAYTLTSGTINGDYTITLDLPNPPIDPANAWQCACNADAGDPYRCVYTNQEPTSLTGIFADFFIYRANLNNTAWWQALGGQIYAETNIETAVPSLTCIAPACTPALIGSDVNDIQDSAGFPSTNTGNIVTDVGGNTYIHEVDARSTSLQGQAQGVEMPIEDYSFFSKKIGGQATTLSNAIKPTPGSELGIYIYTGDLTITEANPWNVSNTEQIVVLVDGNLIFDDTATSEARLTTVAEGGIGFLQFIVSGNTTVNSSVGYSNITTDPTLADIATLEGVFISDGLFTVQGTAATTDRKLIGAGTFVGWSGVNLERNFDDGANPTFNNEDATETFIYRPDLMINIPQILKSAHITWQEVAPQWSGN